MNRVDPDNEMEAMIADYINDRLTPTDRAHFEAVLSEDEALQKTVAFEREIKSVIAGDHDAEAELPRFASLESRLDASSRTGWLANLRWGAPLAAALMLALVFGINAQREIVHDDFELLTDTSTMPTQPVLRVVTLAPMTSSDQAAFMERFGLTVVAEYAGTNTIDFTTRSAGRLEAIAEALQQDPKIRIVRVVDHQNGEQP